MNSKYRHHPSSEKIRIVAVEKGLITLDQLIEAMNISAMETMQKGIQRSIGWILLEK